MQIPERSLEIEPEYLHHTLPSILGTKAAVDTNMLGAEPAFAVEVGNAVPRLLKPKSLTSTPKSQPPDPFR